MPPSASLRSTASFVLERPRLLDLVQVPSVAPVTLVMAPAGYGKTTFVRQWTETMDGPVAWVSLDATANHPDLFIDRILGTMPGIVADQEHGSVTVEAVLAALDAHAGRAHPVTIVLDDLHLIENLDILQALDTLLLARLPHVRWVLLSRTTPALTLARLRLEGAVRDIGPEDLGFTRKEVMQVVARTLPEQDLADIDALTERTGGWIAGISLAIAAGGLEGRSGEAIVPWTAETWLDDYIEQEVLAPLPDPLRRFVLRTVHLPYLEPGLCDAVLGSGDSAALIEEARTRLVLVRPGGPGGNALIYHSLFAESAARIFARASHRDERLDLHRRAACWLRDRGDLASAADQAIRGEEWGLALEMTRAICRSLVDRDHSHSAWYWLRQLPRDLLLPDPEFARWYISTLHHLGRHQEAEAAYSTARSVWQESGEPAYLAYDLLSQTLGLAMKGDSAGAVNKAYEAVAVAPDDLTVDLMHAWTYIYQIESFRGNDDKADHAFREAERHRALLPADQWYWFSNTEPHRINTEAIRGRLHAADQMYTHKLEARPRSRNFLDGKLRYRRSAIRLEWNDLARVETDLDDIRQQAQGPTYRIWHQEALMHVAQAQGALGNLDGMDATLRQVREMFGERGGRHNLNRLEALEADLWLATDRLPLAQDWARRKAGEDYAPPLLFGDPDPRLARVKVMIAGDEPDRAIEALAPMIEDATARRRWAEVVSLAAWEMTGHLHLGDRAAALESLALALQHGRRGGFERSFMVQGPEMFPFLRTALMSLPEDDAAYLHALIGRGVWGAPPKAKAGGATDAWLPDPISRREMDVLRLLPMGITNREIGERLFISEHTVKRHVGSILAKLQATDRRAAVIRAWQLGLLEEDD